MIEFAHDIRFGAAATVPLLLLLAESILFAQELTPRAYWPAPTGTKLAVFGYSRSTGDIVTDPSLPISGVESRINTGLVAYQQTFELAGRTTNLQVAIPYTDGKTTGEVQGISARADVSGLGDITATLSINLLGAPSMTVADFQALRGNPRPILGASLRVVAPTGQYSADKLINIGSNRWAVRAELGYIQPLNRKWLLELALGVWFFEDNDNFLGVTREQEPITSLTFHLIRRFRPGFWTSLDLNYYADGRTIVDGVRKADFQRNSRAGLSLAFPFKKRHAFKAGYSQGVVTESGGDYQTFLLSYVYLLN